MFVYRLGSEHTVRHKGEILGYEHSSSSSLQPARYKNSFAILLALVRMKVSCALKIKRFQSWEAFRLDSIFPMWWKINVADDESDWFVFSILFFVHTMSYRQIHKILVLVLVVQEESSKIMSSWFVPVLSLTFCKHFLNQHIFSLFKILVPIRIWCTWWSCFVDDKGAAVSCSLRCLITWMCEWVRIKTYGAATICSSQHLWP